MGAWDAIRDGLGSVLAFFFDNVYANSGVAIILLTVVVRLALFPLTAKQAKSMLAMQRVQPEIKKLQAKYKNDRQKLNEEMMKFYKENQINPLGGCLPLLLQMPVFIALFQTLQKIQNFIPTGSDMYADLCGKGIDPGKCKPDMKFLGMDLTKSAGKAAEIGIGDAAPYLVLVALVMVTGYLQQRQTMRNQTAPNPQMVIISKVFPIVFGVISWGIPSGVVLYFFTSNLWQIGQQEVVIRTIGSAAGPPPRKARALAEGSSESGDQDSSPGGGTEADTTETEKGDAGSGPAKRGGPGPTKKTPAKKTPTKKTPAKKTSGRQPPAKGSDTGTGKSTDTPSGKPAGNGQARSNRKRKR